ncbi:MAG: hypothetical protein WBO46_22315 [Caldilineaceae bacterium]
MAIILSISAQGEQRWAAGPYGLFSLEEGELLPLSQPMERLILCTAIHDRLLVGGAPHGIAYQYLGGDEWQAAWLGGATEAALCLAPHPDVFRTAVLLAGTEGDGVLRSTDRGHRWTSCNFGLRNYTILSLAWAPLDAKARWPGRELVFAGSEEGIYRSPSGGRGWKRSDAPEAAYQSIAISPSFHSDGVVLAGTEEQGLYRSADSGLSFTLLKDAPSRINSLVPLDGGWLLSDEEQLWRSADGITWQAVAGSAPALVLTPTSNGILAGTENGVQLLDGESLAVVESYGVVETA